MTVLGGGLFLIEVETAPNIWTEAADLTRVARSDNRNVSRTRVFRKTYRASGISDRTLTLAGLLNYADPGQTALLAAERANTSIRVRWSERGTETDMTMQTVRVATVSHDATPAPGEIQTITFELRGVGDPTAVSISPTTPAGLMDRFNQLGVSGAGGTMLQLYAVGVNQTIKVSGDVTLPTPATASPTGFFCTLWDDAVNPGQGKHWRPSLDLWGGNGAPCSASGIIQGAGLELPNSTGLTGGAAFHGDPGLKTDPAIAGSGNLRPIGADKTAGLGVGMIGKWKDGSTSLQLGEAGDLNKIEAMFGDDFGNVEGLHTSAAFWSAGAQSAAGTPMMHRFTHINHVAEPEAGGTWENWVAEYFGRDMVVFKQAPANSLAAGRRMRLGGDYGNNVTGAARSIEAVYITAGRLSKSQMTTVADYAVAVYTAYDDARDLGFLFGDSEFVMTWQQADRLAITDGTDGATAMPDLGLFWNPLTGTRPQLMMHFFCYYMQALDFSKRGLGRVAVMISEWINATPGNETLTDAIAQNYYLADMLKAIDPARVRIAMHNMTFASNFLSQQTLNDPAIDNDLNTNAVAGGHALGKVDFIHNTVVWNPDAEIYTATGDPNRANTVWQGIHPFHLTATMWRQRIRIAMHICFGDDISNITAEVLSSIPVVTLTAGAPTSTPTWTSKSNSNATLTGKTLVFSMYKHLGGGDPNEALDNTIATVNASTGLITRVAAGLALCLCVASDGGRGFCVVKCT